MWFINHIKISKNITSNAVKFDKTNTINSQINEAKILAV